ncbi:uncharacterized protein E0L32_011092 [Thyridium curvatum]|uniref:Uncharacterized protein n=1 Tax=Thyridium curvatum TaxID=1093900 RepID=A0A507AJF5_9PEZI|nr:uncharacterized protein E0L32_011092 [Thyridium curvatum]TPX06947.1 hypothetical protein E0L32_011092 [Thyridium curvatum]
MDSKKAPLSLLEDDAAFTVLPRATSPAPSSRFSLRRSSHSFRPSIDPESLNSCVSRDTSSDECARHRFIVWAAVKRNTSQRMTDQERLECPLLRCTRRFASHELMLRHLVTCDQLPSCEYWCYEHMRLERFDDRKCKRCLGHPSKRRKMLCMAKNFFSSLGHKPKKGQEDELCLPGSASLTPPPSYNSLHAELPPDGIMEIDSTELAAIPEQPAADASIDPQALLLPELDSTAIPAIPFVEWPAEPTINLQSLDLGKNLAAKPTLQLNTNGLGSAQRVPRPRPVVQPVIRSKNLSPSSSVRSNASTMSNISSIISPISTWSHGSYAMSGLETGATSPTGELVSPIDFFGDNEMGGCTGLETDAFLPQLPNDAVSELPAELPAMDNVLPDLLTPDPFALLFEPSYAENLSYESDIIAGGADGDVRAVSPLAVKESTVCEAESPALIVSAWDALLVNITSSLANTRDIQGNRFVDQLRTLSPNSIASTGLRVLQNSLQGQPPTSPMDTICFIHLIYAFSLATYESHTSSRCDALFLQALAYNYYLDPSQQRAYTQVVSAVWNPGTIPSSDLSQRLGAKYDALRRSSSRKGKELGGPAGTNSVYKDPLLLAAQDYLDELESSVIVHRVTASLKTSDIWNHHFRNVRLETPGNSPFHFAATYILGEISKFPGVEGLGSHLQGIDTRLRQGFISSVRRLELELLQAGKRCMSIRRFSDVFAPLVRGLCDPLYKQDEPASSHRASYYEHCITMIEQIIGELSATHASDDMSETFEGLIDAFTNQLGNESEQEDKVVGPSDPVGSSAALIIPAVADDQQHTKPAEQQQKTSSSSTLITPPSSSSSGDDDDTPSDGQSKATEANSCCEICGYRPKGDPQWFKGSMAKHKKLQHSTSPPKIYKCPYPGCSSQYKNRPDNLRQHQIEKDHWVGGDGPGSRRPSKRKKMSD